MKRIEANGQVTVLQEEQVASIHLTTLKTLA